VSGDVVYVGGPNGYVYAFNRYTGAVLWQFLTNPLRGIVASLALVGSDTVIAHGVDGYIYAIHSGQLAWKYDSKSPGIPAGYADSTPLLVNGVVYVGAGPAVYAFEASTGKLKWVFNHLGWVQSSPTVVQGMLYVGSNDGQVYALDALTGTFQWSFYTGNPVFGKPTVGNGDVYFSGGDLNTHLYAVTAGPYGGKVVWQDDIKAIIPGCQSNTGSPVLGP
jgi:outer membrane protein assembly factor BamB